MNKLNYNIRLKNFNDIIHYIVLENFNYFNTYKSDYVENDIVLLNKVIDGITIINQDLREDIAIPKKHNFVDDIFDMLGRNNSSSIKHINNEIYNRLIKSVKWKSDVHVDRTSIVFNDPYVC